MPSPGGAAPRPRCTSPGGQGQATIEAVLALPVLLIGLVLIVQVGVVVRDALALGVAAREGAREAAVWADDRLVAAAVVRSAGPLEADRIGLRIEPQASTRRRGDPVTVSLTYIEVVRIPILERLVDLTVPLRASVTMRLERSVPTPSPEPSPTPGPEPSPTPGHEPSPTPEPPGPGP